MSVHLERIAKMLLSNPDWVVAVYAVSNREPLHVFFKSRGLGTLSVFTERPPAVLHSDEDFAEVHGFPAKCGHCNRRNFVAPDDRCWEQDVDWSSYWQFECVRCRERDRVYVDEALWVYRNNTVLVGMCFTDSKYHRPGLVRRPSTLPAIIPDSVAFSAVRFLACKTIVKRHYWRKYFDSVRRFRMFDGRYFFSYASELLRDRKEGCVKYKRKGINLLPQHVLYQIVDYL